MLVDNEFCYYNIVLNKRSKRSIFPGNNWVCNLLNNNLFSFFFNFLIAVAMNDSKMTIILIALVALALVGQCK